MEKDMNALLDQLEAKLATVTTKPVLMGTTLPIVTKICHKLDYRDLERWAAEKLGIRNLEFTDSDNDSDHDFDVITRDYKFWDQALIDNAIDTAKSRLSLPIYEAGNLLSYFADAGLIPEGNYIINVSW